MKRILLIVSLSFFAWCNIANAQATATKKDLFPTGTTVLENIPYANDTLAKHTLDIYYPPVKTISYPLIVWVHGGGWKTNDKHADMGYMVNTLKLFLDKGYAIASIDYRWSTQTAFPGQVIDCNQAIEFLYKNRAQYNLDASRLALIGFSAGGHLASLVALSNNNHVKAFYPKDGKPDFKISLVLDFYGPANLLTQNGHDSTDPQNSLTLLLGGIADKRPDLAKKASPIFYIDQDDPPFLIVQGEKDESVNPEQSVALSNRLKKAGVKNELIIVPGAPHYGPMFDAQNIRDRIAFYLDTYMQ